LLSSSRYYWTLAVWIFFTYVNVSMPNRIREDLHMVDDQTYAYKFEQNVTIKLKSFEGLVRCNIYRPKTDDPVPVIMTYGPYGKDVPYKE
jgi:hypothetical protein